MKSEKYIEEKFGRDPGFSVPENYFDILFTEMPEKLPPYPEAPRAVDMSFWQRIKPYVYMAAMFAGIWLMMNVFHHVSDSTRLSLDNPPEAVTLAMAEMNDSDLDFHAGYDNDFAIMDDLSSSYASFEEFERDFDYDMSSEYKSMKVSGI